MRRTDRPRPPSITTRIADLLWQHRQRTKLPKLCVRGPKIGQGERRECMRSHERIAERLL